MDKLLERLQTYIDERIQPSHKDVALPTMASQGPKYKSLDELEERMAERRRGLTLKPHYITQAESTAVKEKTAKAKRALEKKAQK